MHFIAINLLEGLKEVQTQKLFNCMAKANEIGSSRVENK